MIEWEEYEEFNATGKLDFLLGKCSDYEEYFQCYKAILNTDKEIHIVRRDSKFRFGFAEDSYEEPTFISGRSYKTLENAKKASVKYLINQLQTELKELTSEVK